MARDAGLKTIGLLGRDGGKAARLCDVPIIVPHSDTQRIQEVHIMIGHMLAEIAEETLIEPAP